MPNAEQSAYPSSEEVQLFWQSRLAIVSPFITYQEFMQAMEHSIQVANGLDQDQMVAVDSRSPANMPQRKPKMRNTLEAHLSDTELASLRWELTLENAPGKTYDKDAKAASYAAADPVDTNADRETIVEITKQTALDRKADDSGACIANTTSAEDKLVTAADPAQGAIHQQTHADEALSAGVDNSYSVPTGNDQVGDGNTGGSISKHPRASRADASTAIMQQERGDDRYTLGRGASHVFGSEFTEYVGAPVRLPQSQLAKLQNAMSSGPTITQVTAARTGDALHDVTIAEEPAHHRATCNHVLRAETDVVGESSATRGKQMSSPADATKPDSTAQAPNREQDEPAGPVERMESDHGASGAARLLMPGNRFPKRGQVIAESFEDQLNALVTQGLQVEDRTKAIRLLSRVNIWSLQQYLQHWRYCSTDPNGGFRRTACFEDVQKLYEVERQLSGHVGALLQEIELTLRTRFVQAFVYCKGADANFVDVVRLGSPGREAVEHPWYQAIERQLVGSDNPGLQIIPEARRGKPAIRLKDFRKIPVWVLVEFCTFGALNGVMHSCEWAGIPQHMAQELRMSFEDLQDMTADFVDLRNSIAHHRTLWNAQREPLFQVSRSELEAHLGKTVEYSWNSVYAVLVSMSIFAQRAGIAPNWLNEIIHPLLNANPILREGVMRPAEHVLENVAYAAELPEQVIRKTLSLEQLNQHAHDLPVDDVA
ncbi:MAG: Abi family protein [Corynebacterium sp.]|nr:Abi family protein [Corynebacterium sp.]